MAANRLEILRGLVAREPGDNRTRYMLAVELGKAGEMEAALEELQAIIAAEADYTAAYYQSGQALEKLERFEEARSAYQRGIEACTRTGNEHAKDHLRDVLEALG